MIKVILIFLCFIYASATELTLGIVPQQSPLVLSQKWHKVTEYLKKETGINIIFQTKSTIPQFEKELYNGNYDISYMNPYHFIIANQTQKYNAFIRNSKNIVGIILSKEEKIDFTNISNLKGKTFLFPAPNSFAATLLPKFELKKKFNFNIENEAQILYVNSHDSVYKGIARDIGYLGGGITRTFDNFKDIEDKKKLHIVYKTDSYPSHPIAYHPRVDKKLINKIENALMNMPDDIKKSLSMEKLVKTTTQEYDIIKEIGIK